MLEVIWSPAFKRGSLSSEASQLGALVLSTLQVISHYSFSTEEQTLDDKL